MPGWSGVEDWIYLPDGDPAVAEHLAAPPFDDGDTREQMMNHAKLVAESIPTLSGPAGGMAIGTLKDVKPDPRIDMNDVNFKNAAMWPKQRPRKSPEQCRLQRWLHGDYKDAPFLLTFGLYRKLVEIAE